MKTFLELVWRNLKRAIECRLCKRITVSVFLAILVVEAAILFFSVRSFERDRLIEVEREAVVVMRAILRSADLGAQGKKLPEIAKSLRQGSVLIGARVFEKPGMEIASFGEKPDTIPNDSGNLEETALLRLPDNTRMEKLWPPERLQEPYWVMARIDTSEIDEQIIAFVWRIAGLVLLISVFVTFVTMVVLDKMVLMPILNFRSRLTATGSDPNNPEKYLFETHRSDEWGEVIRAFNQMLHWSQSNLDKLGKNEAELVVAKEEAEQSNQAKSEFLANMSHELRTPLNAILGYAQMLQFDPETPLTENQNKHAENILSGGNHLRKLIDEVLDLARIEANKVDLSIEDVNAEYILAECVKLTAPLGEERRISIIDAFSDKEPAVLRTDQTRLKQVILNLLSNAVKYNKDGGTVTLDTYTNDETGYFRLSVTDTGVGIATKDQPNVFQKFNRFGMDARDAQKGTGIGLTVTKLLVERMAGRVGFESKEGVGSTFWIEIPLTTNKVALIWTESLRVGIDAIDKDHQVIISLLNRISHHAFDADELDGLIKEMVYYTEYHFSREEAVMLACAYPEIVSHKERHKKLIAQMNDLKAKWDKDKNAQTIQTMRQFLREWWMEHILEVDVAVTQFAKGKENEILLALENIERAKDGLHQKEDQFRRVV